MTDEAELDLGFIDPTPTTAELRDPGLYPTFKLFIANWLNGYLRYAPFRINSLFSAYHALEMSGLTEMRMYVSDARFVFLDSGAITALARRRRGAADTQHVYDYLARQPDVIALAWRLHEDGAPPGVVAAMDLPAYADLLAPSGMTVEQGEAITVRNAIEMLAADLPPGWRPVFTSQGVSIAEHERCLELYDRAGILDTIRRGEAWLAVGGMAFDIHSDSRVHQVHKRLRQLMGDTAHIHALGIGRLDTLTPMVKRVWVNSADTSRPCQKVRYNIHPLYRVEGPRPTFLVEALHAAAGLQLEADLAMRLQRDLPDYEQEGLFDQVQEVLTA